jgi:hypothetical protein
MSVLTRLLAPFAAALVVSAFAIPSHAAEPEQRLHLPIVARVGATDFLWSGASLGLQAGVRFPNGIEIGALGDWGGLRDAVSRPPDLTIQARFG